VVRYDMSKTVKYRDHADARMAQRDITKEDVESVVANPAITLPSRGHRQRVIGYCRGRGLNVVFEEIAEVIWVVSTYWVQR
jgi:hypothetical protein